MLADKPVGVARAVPEIAGEPRAEDRDCPVGVAAIAAPTLPTAVFIDWPVIDGTNPIVVDPKAKVEAKPVMATTAFCWPCAEKGASAKVVIPNAIN